MQHAVHWRLFAAAFALIAWTRSVAAVELPVDLARAPGTTQAFTVLPGDSFTVVVVNRAPAGTYTITTAVDYVPLPPLTWPAAQVEVPRALGCTHAALRNSLATLERPDASETAVKAVVDAWPAVQRRDPPDPTQCAEELAQLTSAIERTRERVTALPEKLPAGRIATVTVIRAAPGDTSGEAKQWTATISTGAPGEWRVSYGFVFLPDRDKEYFTEAVAPGSFQIRRKARSGGFDFAPSIFFTYVPRSREPRAYVLGPTAGLGFDLSNPVVFLGLNLTYRENIALVAGVAAQRQTRLEGRFSEGQTIQENLESSQLEREVYRANGFLGVTFRFGASPFGRSGGQ